MKSINIRTLPETERTNTRLQGQLSVTLAGRCRQFQRYARASSGWNESGMSISRNSFDVHMTGAVLVTSRSQERHHALRDPHLRQ